MKIAFFGTAHFAQLVLKKLIRSPYKPQLVITAPDTKSGRGQHVNFSPVKQTALENKIEVLQAEKLNGGDIKVKLSGFDLAILVAYGKIIPKEILSLPKYGFVNVHPSLLPKYRGPSPIQTAILNGETKTGITIMLLDEEIDHGPILAAKKITISTDDTHQSLAEFLGKIGANLLIQTLPKYIKGELKPKTQNHTFATFTEHITKQDGFINLQNPPDNQLFERMVRAYFPWPTVWTKIDGKIIKFLPDSKIQPEGKKPITLKEFLNGYPKYVEIMKTLFKQ